MLISANIRDERDTRCIRNLIKSTRRSNIRYSVKTTAPKLTGLTGKRDGITSTEDARDQNFCVKTENKFANFKVIERAERR